MKKQDPPEASWVKEAAFFADGRFFQRSPSCRSTFMPVILSMLKHGSWNYGTMFFFVNIFDVKFPSVFRSLFASMGEFGVKM